MRFITHIFTLILLLPLISYGQSQTENYIQSTNYQIETTTGNNVGEDSKIQSVTYYDGLGRPKQTIARRAGGDREDLVTPVLYDDFGRQPKDYLPLPLPGNNGAFNNNTTVNGQPGVTHSLNTYYENKFYDDFHNLNGPSTVVNPYSEKHFEDSPLNRVQEQGAPGGAWRVRETDSDHTVKFEHRANSGSEVRNFSVGFENGNTELPFLEYNDYYPPNQLYKNVTKDENWQPSNGNNHTTQEFKNKLGQVLLKRAFNNGQEHDTYYVYDDYGNLTYVLSPKGLDEILIYESGIGTHLVSDHQNVLDNLCYQYKYDHRNRLIWKKIPGKGHETIYYDNQDRPILTQDANMREENPNKYLFTKYDCLGRVAYTGIFINGFLGSPIETQIETASQSHCGENQITAAYTHGGKLDTAISYTDVTYPYGSSSKPLQILTVNYYDEYVDYTGVSKPTTVMGEPTTENNSVATTTQGLPTVSKVRILGTGEWTTTLTAYDKKGRAVFTDSKNTYLETRDIIRKKLDFTGKPVEALSTHYKTGNPSITTRDYFSYDHMGRMTNHLQQIGDGPLQLITGNTYDELGQLVSKKVGGELFESGYSDLVNTTANSVSGEFVITKKSSASDNWNAGVATKGKLDGDGGIEFEVVGEGNYFVVGFNDLSNEIDPINNDPDLAEIDFAFQFKQNGSGEGIFLIRENNTPVSGTNSSYQQGDAFAIETEGSTLSYIHNGVVVHTSSVSPNSEFVGDASFKTPGAKIKNLNLYATKITKYLQNVNYAYNIRGWLTDINPSSPSIGIGYTDLFHFHINYNRPIEGSAGDAGKAVPLYNGNISQTTWKTKSTDDQWRTYGYKYDDLNRIKVAYSRKGQELSTEDRHSVWGIGYDKNGNIQSLVRNGSNENGTATGKWDDLSYSYSGNQVIKVVENSTSSSFKDFGFKDGTNGGTDYKYDHNGNITLDNNKGITSITYNHLNLPETITFEPNPYTNTITYVYDATGAKLKKTLHKDTNADIHTEYAGNFVYSDMENVGAIKLQFFNQPEGYVIPVLNTGGSVKGFDTGTGQETYSAYSYVFQYKDHLGNVRLSYSDANLDGAIQTSGTNSEIIEESNYYPFGLQHKGYNNVVTSTNPAQNYKFNGKELNEELGLDWYDFGARNYDAALGRWMNLDPLAEQMRRHSPYNYAFNNPLRFTDPDGMAPDDVIILINPKGAYGFGHMAMLVGDDKNGWTYVSKDGRADSNGDGNQDGTILTGGKSTSTVKTFDTLDDALNDGTVQGYEKGYRIETTPEEDAKMLDVAKEDVKTDYNVLSSNCADTCSESLESVGKDGGNSISERTGASNGKPAEPNARYREIVKNNPGGTTVKVPEKKTTTTKPEDEKQ